MKNGKTPTRNQRKLIKSSGLDPVAWLVVKDTVGYMEVVSRIGLKKEKVSGKKPKTRKLHKDIK